MGSETSSSTIKKLQPPVSNIHVLPPSAQELHAYIDNELAPRRRRVIVAWLINHPEELRELLKMQFREDTLRIAMNSGAEGDSEISARLRENAFKLPGLNFDLAVAFLAGALTAIVGVVLASQL